MSGKFVVIVLDGFGVGEMEDTKDIRPADIGSNTCAHIFENMPGLTLPTLEKLGLANAVGREFETLHFSPSALYGKSKLMHQGADTFYGHQEIMGTKPPKPLAEAIQSHIEEIKTELSKTGFKVREFSSSESGNKILIVNEACTVADNIECDPGQAFNVTAAIDDIDFETELTIGCIVRKVAKTPRVITFGGRGVHLQNLLDAIEEHGNFIGVNAPASGVYDNNYHCVHMGYGIDEKVQVPFILGEQKVPVYLLGKVADVCANAFGQSESIVDTAQVLSRTLAIVSSIEGGFVCTNVQETDLQGHGESVPGYAEKLRIADSYIAQIIDELQDDDILIVMADHGNDPTIGHPHHTREHVPLLIYTKNGTPKNIGVRETLSDVGATVADYFGAPSPENGTSFLSAIRE